MSNARFSITQSIAVEDKKLSNAQFRTLAALGIYGDKKGWCFPKLATLGKVLGKSRQAVSKDIQKLKELEYLEVHPQYRKNGSRKHNLYRLVFDAPPQRGDDTPSTSEVDTPSTPEVDALTPHINAPHELKDIIVVNKPNIFKIYERDIGLIPNNVKVLGELKDADAHYPEEWIDKAFTIAVENNVRNWAYVRKILSNWDKHGFDTKKSKNNGNNQSTAEMLAAWEAEEE